MNETFLNSAYFWRVTTHLGASGLLLPVFVAQLLALWSSQRAAAHRWLIGLGLTVLVTLVSKCLFWGWGIGSASLDFTGISGHTMLATSILPVFFCLRIPADSNHLRHLGTTFGLLLAVGVGFSRIVLGAHSVSEVFAGWLIGLAVSTVTIRALGNSVQPSLPAQFSALLLLFAFSGTTANFLQTHNWEVKLALLLSGHSKPFTRHQLRQQNKPPELLGLMPF